ncbi:actin-related protein 8-like [Teleopsis dalmanni]|uniref:actin-related protein 8-like n=1 Tax=Teleopsis dalmanni TaxID=139649 RepID=UPI000D329457|nr:actin-related protein 8-like [Teleopsis dalmanni]
MANKIIVIHPGSRNLRIGRASDLNPITILHAVGRKHRLESGLTSYQDGMLPPLLEPNKEFEENRLQVAHSIQLQAYPKHASKRSRISTPPQQISTFNRRSVPEELPLDKDHTVKLESTETIFDQTILSLTSSEAKEYNVHFPLRRGELNLHNGIGGSMSSVLENLEAIWLHVINDKMGITPKLLSQYNAVLVIPDVYNRSHLREMVTLLLQRLRFASCFLLQDHVSATFGAGLGYACVVDLGDQKCSISCVEDAISQPDTRVRLAYGGADVTQVFYTLLRKCSFPYKECKVENSYQDATLLTHLKERFCHLNFEICGAQEKTFNVQTAKHILCYTIQLGDECLVAPMSLFHTELLNITGKLKDVRTQLRSSQQPDAEDCFDAEYIRETGRRNGREGAMMEGTMPTTGDVGEDDLVVVETFDVDTTIKNGEKEEQNFMINGQIVSLDQAIVRSIERCGNDEMKRKMYGCILIVGGGIKFGGFAKCLEQKVTLSMASYAQQRTPGVPQFEVNIVAKEMDAGMIAWKGAAIMSCLESAPELWIMPNEWEKYGLRVLREKAPFMW